MQGNLKPLPRIESAQAKPLTGLFLVTEDQMGIAAYVMEALRSFGATAAILPTSVLRTRDSLVQAVAQLRATSGTVTGIIHLAGLTDTPIPSQLETWSELSQIQSKSLFHLLQLCASDLQQSQGQVLGASMLGGCFGRSGHSGPGLPLNGSHSGLLKTMMIEWQTVRAKVVDFAGDTVPTDVAAHVLRELISPDQDIEIGYPNGQRTVFDAILAPLDTTIGQTGGDMHSGVRPSPDWIVLCIGGARGITAEIVRSLLLPGMTLILVGRAREPIAESAQFEGVEDVNLLRRLFIKQAQEQGQSLTPAKIEQQIKQLQRDREIRTNLKLFREFGANVEYHSVDVNDASLFSSLIEAIYGRYGRIDAVIQGAGIIQDKLIIDKSADSFEQVFNTKVDSTFILSRYLRPDSLKLVIIFASVAGRTGNRGQCDYAAANEVMNRFAWWMHEHWINTKVLCINWGPWDVKGMASEAVNRQFKERGVNPIPPAAGQQFLLNELLYGRNNQVELITGFFAGDAPQSTMTVPDPSQQLKASTPAQARSQTRLPLIQAPPLLQPNGAVRLNQIISLETHPYLRDHCLDGKPVLAAACALELMAEFVQTAWPDWVVSEVRALRVLRGIVLKSEAGQPILLQATASTHAHDETLQVTAEILDPDKGMAFYRAFVILRPQVEDSQTIHIPSLDSTTGLNVATSYRDYCFHGPLFQLLTSIDRFNEEGMTALVRASSPQSWLNDPQSSDQWLFDPGLIDAALQMAAIWSRIQGDTGGLPARFKRVVRFGHSQPEGPLRIEFRVKLFNPTTMVFDALFLDSNDRLVLQLEDMENTCSQALKRLSERK